MLLTAYSMALLIVVLYRLGGPGEMALFMIYTSVERGQTPIFIKQITI